jgi:hypothetical protein
MLINLFWSALCLTPVSVFCYQHLNLKLLFIFLAISLLPLFFPKSFYNSIQLAKTTLVYKRLGVEFIQKFTQNGELINKLIRKKNPDYKIVSANRRSIKKLRNQTYMFEKFHFMMFSIFVFIMIYALVKGFLAWAAIIFFTNLLYNVYPNLLQQYIRMRLAAF